MRHAVLPLALFAALLVACNAPSTAVKTQGTGSPLVISQFGAGQTIAGLVKAPPGVVASGGGNVVASGGGNVVASVGGNVVASGGLNYHVAGVPESGLAGVTVVLTDETGRPLPGVAPVKTDADGRYSFDDAPTGQLVLVAAQVRTAAGADALLRAMVKPAADDAHADLTAASTLVTAGLVSAGGPALARFKASAYERLVTATATYLTEADLPDWAAPQAVTGAFAKVRDRQAELRSAWAAVASSETTTFAGRELGADDGVGALARFSGPHGVAVDASGLVYVADEGNHRIRKITPDGKVTNLAGGVRGFNSAQFSAPSDVAVDHAGNIYVADYGNHAIRRVSPDGVVTTVAGSGQAGATDDSPTVKAAFNHPLGLAIDASDTLYVADQDNHSIRKVSPAGQVSTLAGSGTAGSSNGAGTGASFNRPSDVAVASDGSVYVADTGNHQIRRIDKAGTVTTFAGGTAGYRDGQAAESQFDTPSGLVLDASGNLYVSDTGNHLIRMIEPTGRVWTIAGHRVTPPGARRAEGGFADGSLLDTRFNDPSGLAFGPDGRLYVADSSNNRIRRLF